MQNHKNLREYSAVILSAGKSVRMGSPKLLLKYDETKTFVEHIVQRYSAFGCREIILVVNEDTNQILAEKELFNLSGNLKIVINKYPEYHRFYSLKLAAQNLSKVRGCYVHNVDNPYVRDVILGGLLQYAADFDYVIPTCRGRGGHPFFISEQVVETIRKRPENELHLRKFLNQFSQKRVELGDENILANINTPEMYRKFKAQRQDLRIVKSKKK